MEWRLHQPSVFTAFPKDSENGSNQRASKDTGVLIGATAIPVWHENRRLIPAHFLTSGLGGSSAILELFGFFVPATQILGFTAAGIETAVGVILELRHGRVDAPLHHGKSGWTMRIAGTLEGPIALLVRILWHGSANGRYAAAACFLLGALCSRYAWIWAGRASAHDPQALFESQHAAMTASRAAAPNSLQDCVATELIRRLSFNYPKIWKRYRRREAG